MFLSLSVEIGKTKAELLKFGEGDEYGFNCSGEEGE